METINDMDNALIFSYGIQMMIVLLAGLGLWTLKVKMSPTDTIAWYRSNALSIGISFGVCWLISAGLVVVPNFAQVLGGLGFNADQSTAGIALVIAGFLIGGSFDPGEKGKGI
jgi:hypothetical protein